MMTESCFGVSRRNAHAGNTLVEYVLPGLGIVVVSLAALQLLAGNINLSFDGIKGEMQSHITATAQQNQIQAAKNAALEAAQSQQSSDGSIPDDVTPSMDGISAEDISSAIQTAGANGGTEVLASEILGQADKMLESGAITEEQYNILKKLANEGHALAQAEAALKSAVDGGQGSVTYNGQTYSTTDFKEMFGFNNSIGIDAASSMDAGSAMQMLSPFMNTYQEAVNSGALSDPAVNSQITNLSKQVAALSDLAKWNTTSSPTDLNNAYVTAIEQVGIQDAATNVSDATNTKSGQICTTGSGSDSGTNCQ